MKITEKPKVKIKNEDEEKLEFMIVNKTPLHNIIKSYELYNEINDVVYKVNKIIIQASQFLNLYLIYLFDNNLDFPNIDKQFILTIFSVITKKNDGRGKKPSEDTLKVIKNLENFYNRHYKQCITDDDIINIDKLSFVLAYESIDIVKNIKNNITEHFQDYVNKFVNQSFEVKFLIQDINNLDYDVETKKEIKNSIYTDLRKVKKDLLRTDNEFESDEMFHNWIKIHKPFILRKNKLSKNSIDYDLCVSPLDYIKSLFYMNKELEKINQQRIKEEKDQFKLFQVIPQRTSIKSNYITIDSAEIVNLTITSEFKKYFDNLEYYRKELWDKNFTINQKEFKRKGYEFNYMIKTDGVGCSVLLVKLKDGKPIEITQKMQRELQKKLEKKDIYIEDIKITNDIKNKRIVCLDPNLQDIYYAVSKEIKSKIIMDENNKLKLENKEEIITFRYTQNQRRLETRNKKYNKLQDKINKETKINNKSVKEIETELSKFNSKTCDFNNFMEYCQKKNEINRLLFSHYQEEVFRKLKFNRYTNTQKSESKMIKNFSNKFGKPEDCILVLGDYDKGEHNMKGKEPIINRRIRKIFRNNGYKVYMINEFRTSKLCNVCESCCSPFLKRESNKPKDIDKKTKKRKLIEVWGLTLCENKKCSLIHNRDKNSALNMYKITQSILNGKGRPKKYCREIKQIHSC
jgi:arginine repressor